MGGRAEEEQTHGPFLIPLKGWSFSGSAVCLPELYFTVTERPKELTHTALASGILGNLNKSRRHLLSPLL